MNSVRLRQNRRNPLRKSLVNCPLRWSGACLKSEKGATAKSTLIAKPLRGLHCSGLIKVACSSPFSAEKSGQCMERKLISPRKTPLWPMATASVSSFFADAQANRMIHRSGRTGEPACAASALRGRGRRQAGNEGATGGCHFFHFGHPRSRVDAIGTSGQVLAKRRFGECLPWFYHRRHVVKRRRRERFRSPARKFSTESCRESSRWERDREASDEWHSRTAGNPRSTPPPSFVNLSSSSPGRPPGDDPKPAPASRSNALFPTSPVGWDRGHASGRGLRPSPKK